MLLMSRVISLGMEDNYILEAPAEFHEKLKNAREKQIHLKDSLDLEGKISLGNIRLVAGFDVAYNEEDNYACAGVVVVDFRTLEVVEEHITFYKPVIPYIPTFLHLREGQGYHEIYKKIEEKPDILFFDGNGILHPFKMGLASQMGLELKKPSIGIAKKLFKGDYKPPLNQGGYSKIDVEGEVLGIAFQSLPLPAKPIFLSQGNQVSLSVTIHVVREFIQNQKYQTKLPLPIFRAHNLVSEQFKDNQTEKL
jgi:deoxyribonuclease V